MTIQSVVRLGNVELAMPSLDVIQFGTPELYHLIDDMKDTMKEKDGVGIAAPQIGHNQRVIMFGFEKSERYPNEKPIPFTILINPSIEVLSDDMMDGWEGCLSIPGLRGLVPRHTKIKYSGFDAEGNPFFNIVEGFHARVVQHECDHLDGILFPQRIRDMRFFGFEEELQPQSDKKLLLKNKKVLITAGPTHEPIDPVRYIANRSSGKMGYALAEQALSMGATVTLISGPTSLIPPAGVNLIHVKTAAEMQRAVLAELKDQTIFIGAAAVSDYRVTQPANQKIKRQHQSLSLMLEPCVDILQSVCQSNTPTFIVGFAAETENVINNAEKKRLKKGVNLLVVNDVSRSDIGFESNHNAVTVLSNEGAVVIEKASKKIVAKHLLEIIADAIH